MALLFKIIIQQDFFYGKNFKVVNEMKVLAVFVIISILIAGTQHGKTSKF